MLSFRVFVLLLLWVYFVIFVNVIVIYEIFHTSDIDLKLCSFRSDKFNFFHDLIIALIINNATFFYNALLFLNWQFYYFQCLFNSVRVPFFILYNLVLLTTIFYFVFVFLLFFYMSLLNNFISIKFDVFIKKEMQSVLIFNLQRSIDTYC